MVTATTWIQSLSRSDGHCNHLDPVLIQIRWSLQPPDPVLIQIRWSLQPPGSSPYPDQMVTATTPDLVHIQIRWSLQPPGSSPYPDQMVTATTWIQSLSRSDGHCNHLDPVHIQIRWSLQPLGSSPHPDQMVDLHLEMTSLQPWTSAETRTTR